MTAVPDTPGLEAHALTAIRGYTTLFSELSFAVRGGEALTVRGPNGSGKTTLLRILAGLTRAACGEVRWCGKAMRAGDAKLRSAVAFHGHLAGLKEELTVDENLAAWSALDDRKAVPVERRQALETAGLAAHAQLPVRVLSQGQRRRVGLARLALVRRPLWLLDEPLTALDDEAVVLLHDLLERHLDDGAIVVAASHAPLSLSRARHRVLDLGAPYLGALDSGEVYRAPAESA